MRSPPVTRPDTVMVSPKNRLAMGYTVPFIVSHFSRARSTSWAKKGPADTPVAMAKGRAWASSSGSISFSPRWNSSISIRSIPTPLSSWVNSSKNSSSGRGRRAMR